MAIIHFDVVKRSHCPPTLWLRTQLTAGCSNPADFPPLVQASLAVKGRAGSQSGLQDKVSFIVYTTGIQVATVLTCGVHRQTDLFSTWPLHEAGSSNTSTTASIFLLLQSVSHGARGTADSPAGQFVFPHDTVLHHTLTVCTHIHHQPLPCAYHSVVEDTRIHWSATTAGAAILGVAA